MPKYERHVFVCTNKRDPSNPKGCCSAKGSEKIREVFKKEIADSRNPEKATDAKIEEYRDKFAHPYIAAGRGYLDDIIDPRETRPRLIDALESLRTKRDKNPPKKHGNIPL